MPKELTQAVVEEWLSVVAGKFNVHEIWHELGIKSPQSKHHLRKILKRLVEKGDISENGGGGSYRKLDTTAEIIDWQAADPSKTLLLKFPFEEHAVAKIYPKSIIIVAGSKNAGKTAYMYNFIALNMHDFQIDLYNSETSPEQMHERFQPLRIPSPAPFKAYERYDTFADVIHPDHISVIDYLDLNSEVYLVGKEIDDIFRKLNQGVAIIGLQKPSPSVTFERGVKKVIDRDLAYGGAFTAKRAVLYISMGEKRLKLVYVKTPSQPRVNPTNMAWTYNIAEDGVHFINIKRDYGSQQNDLL